MLRIDAHYADPRLAEIYDSANGWSRDRDFYLELAGPRPIRVLDLGCGTGLLCDAYASRNHAVTGADPAKSMLDVARRKAHGHMVEWVQSEAQNFSSEKHFDLIIMTGHAFQVLLEEDDVRSTFCSMGRVLAAGGKIVFESRNPNIDWFSRWNQSKKLSFDRAEILVERNVLKRESNRIQFKTFYHFAEESLASQSELRFWTHDEIQNLLGESGLSVVEVFGDWDKASFNSKSSDEMIFVVQKKK